MASNIQVLYERGLSIAGVADVTRSNYSAIRRALIREGVPIRDKAEGTRLAGIQKRGVPTGNFHTPEQIAARVAASAEVRSAKAVGTTVKSSGYVEYTTGPHKGRAVHVVRIEAAIGRPLARHEVVHHINGDRADNRLSNLELMTRSEHSRHHRIEDISRRQRDDFGRFCGNEG